MSFSGKSHSILYLFVIFAILSYALDVLPPFSGVDQIRTDVSTVFAQLVDGQKVKNEVSPNTTINSAIDDNNNVIANNGISTSNSMKFAFSGTDNKGMMINQFDCSIDGRPFVTCISTNTVNVAGGNHTFSVTSKDNVGNKDLTPASFTWTVYKVNSQSKNTPIGSATDGNEMPPIVNGINIISAIDGNNNTISNNGFSKSTSIRFTFFATDTAGDRVDHLQCNIDNSKYVPCTSPFRFSNLLKDGTHSFEVRRQDSVGNMSSSPASFTWNVDTLSPTTSINAAIDGNKTIVANGTNTNSNSMSFEFSGNDTGGSEGKGASINQFECNIDNSKYVPCTSPFIFSNLLNDSTHTFTVMSDDNAGNKDLTPASFTWTVDTLAPHISINTATDGNGNFMTTGSNTSSNSATFKFSGNDTDGNEGKGVGIKQIECSLDGASFSICTSPVQFTSVDLAEGIHTFQIIAEDNTGNINSSPESFTWAVDTEPPTMTIDSSTDGYQRKVSNGGSTASNSIIFAFSANDTGGKEGNGVGIKKLECKIDSLDFASCTSPLQFKNLSDGGHTLEVMSEDNVGNISPTPVSFIWKIDKVPPTTTITTVVGGNESSIANGSNTRFKAITFAFAGNDTGGSEGKRLGIRKFDCSIDGSKFTACTSPVQLTPANITDGSHIFKVLSIDTSSNKDPSPASFNWTVDSIAPTTTINTAIDGNNIAITNGSTTKSNSIMFKFSDNDTGGVGEDHFECSIDNPNFTICTSPIQFTSINLGDGTHTFRVLSEDNSSNKDPSPASFHWTVDTVPPETSIVSAADGNKSIITSGENTSSKIATFEFSSNDTGGVGVDHLECALDGASFTACTSPVQLTPANILDGSHTFKVIAQDKVGNIRTTPALFNWTVDTSPPATTIDSATDGNDRVINVGGNTSSNSMIFLFSSIDSGVGVDHSECSIDNSNFTTCTSPVQTNNLTDGIHTLKILSDDKVGNNASAPSSFNWTIDTESPSTSIFSAIDGSNKSMIPGSNTSSNSVTFEFSANDTGGSEGKGVGIKQFECSIDNSNFTNCTSPVELDSDTLKEGNHIFKIRAEDSVGNMNPTPASFSWEIDTVPPSTTINTATDGNKSAITNGSNTKSNSIAFKFSGNDTGVGISNFECSTDKSNFTTCNSPIQSKNLTDGAHNFKVRAKDNVGNLDLSPESFSWTVDKVAPLTSINSAIDGNKSAITTGGNTSSNTVIFSFSGTDSGVGLNHFECSVDNSEFVTCTSPLQIDGLKNGDHTLVARAHDGVGNKDLSPASFSWTVDTVAPLTSINSAFDGNKSAIITGSNTSSNYAIFTFSATDTGGKEDKGVGINHYECILDNSNSINCTSPLEINSLREGNHYLQIFSKDNVGNMRSSPASLRWNVDTIPPITSITSATDGNNQTINNNDNSSSTSTKFTFSGNDSGVRVAQLECSLDGGTFSICTSPIQYSSANISDGAHIFQVRSEDNVGNKDPSPSSITWTVDTVPPDANIDSATDGNRTSISPGGNTSSNSVIFKFSGNDTGGKEGIGVGINHFECSIDNSNFTSCTGPVQSNNVTDGAHIFEVRAEDNVGNVSPSPSSFTWTVDKTPPSTTIDSAIDGSNATVINGNNTKSTSMTFMFSGNDTGVGISNFECSIDNSNFTTCSGPVQTNNLTDGAHIFEVRAEDHVGNISPSPSSFAWTTDTTPPSTTVNSATDSHHERVVMDGNSSANSILFEFSGNDTGAGVDHFECSIDNSKYVSCTSPLQIDSLTDGTHTLAVLSEDTSTNKDPSPALFRWTADTTPPTAIINSIVDVNQSSVTNGGGTKSTSMTFAFSGTDTEGVGIDHFDCSIDNSEFVTCSSPVQFNSLKDGAHILQIRAEDYVGNIGPSSSSFTWTVDTNPPATSINSATDGNNSAVASGGNTKSSSMTFAFSGTDTGGVDHFECSIDNSNFTICTSPIQFTSVNLRDGTHTFRVLSEDNSSNKDPSPASFTWTVDTVPPNTTLVSAINGNGTALRSGDNTTSNSMTFAFSANESGGNEGKGVGINHFECSIDNSKFVTCASPFTFTKLLKDGTHTFNVLSVDNSRNKDTSPSSFTWTVDTTPPATSINSATDGNKSAVTNAGTTKSNSMTFAFSGNDTGGVGIDHFECNVDGLTFVTCTSPFTFPSLSEDGQYTLEIRAQDRVGNKDLSPASFTWTVDTSPPATTIDSATDGNNRVITAGGNTSSKSMIFLFSSIDSGVGVDHSECSIDNSKFTLCTSPIQFTSNNLGDGIHTLQIRSEDKVGNSGSSPALFNWTLDTVPPTTSINSATDGNKSAVTNAGTTKSTSMTFTFSGNDTGGIGIAHFECSTDNSDFVTCTSPFTLPNSLKDGAHTFRVLSEDKVGNRGSSPALFNWTVDTVPPTASINSATDGNKSAVTNAGTTKSTSMTFAFSGNDIHGIGIDHFECSIDDSDFVTCTSPFTFPNLLNDGAHTFRVLSEDKVGNRGSSPASFNWTVDTVPPTTTIDSVTDGNKSSVITGGNSSSNSAIITFSGIDTGGNKSKGAGINHFECSLDGGSFSTCSAPLELNGLKDGVHVVEIKASDNIGNNDPTPSSFSWTIDTAPPTTSITSATDGNKKTVTAGGNTTSTSMSFAFSGNDTGTGVKHFECSVDGASFAVCTSPVEYSQLADGPHTMEVRTEDKVASVDASPASFAWTIDTIPPTTSINSVVDSNKNTLSNGSDTRSNSITFTFSGSDTSKVAVKRFQCSLDNSDFADCTSPPTFSNLSDGPHTFKVMALDTSGNNDNSPELFTWKIDTTPPSSNINTALDGKNDTVTNGGNTTSTSMTFTFTSSDVGVGVAHFECSLDGASFTTCTSPVQFKSLSDRSHNLEVLSQDKAGNRGSSPASFNWTVDTVPPTTSISSATDGNKSALSNGGTTKSNSMTFAFSGNDTGGIGIAHFECSIDNSDFVTCTSPFTLPNSLKDGAHTFRVLSEDKAGNRGSSPASFNWIVDTVPPTTSITSSTDGDRSTVTADGNTTSTSMTFGFSGTDRGTGVNHFECSVDGASFTTCTSPVQFNKLSDGSHTLEVRTEDNVANIDASPASFAWTIDTIPPTTSINSVVDSNKNTLSNGSNTRSNSITFTFSGSDTSKVKTSKVEVNRFQCSLDNSDFADCTSPFTFSNLLGNGPHTFKVRALDNSGNNDNSPEIFTWSVDATPPDTTINSAKDGNNETVSNGGNGTSRSMTFTFTGSDVGVGVAHFECSLDGASFTTCASPIKFSNLADGSHTLELRAEDKAGNEGPTPTAFIWTINTTPPNTTINSVTDGNKNTVTNNSNSKSNIVTIAFAAVDAVANVDHFECSTDNSDFADCTSPFRIPNLLSDGPHTIKVKAVDNSGREDPSPALFAWTVDTSAPTTNITSATDGNKNHISTDGGTPSTTMIFTFSGTDTGGGLDRFECSVDGASFTTCASPIQFDDLGSGAHKLLVRAVDNVGNQGITPASFGWNVDATPPDTTINSASDGNNKTVSNGGNTTSTSMTFAFSGSDIGMGLDHFECSIDGASFSTCDTPVKYTDLSIGDHSFEIRAEDKVGNKGQLPPVFLWTITSPPPAPTPTPLTSTQNITTPPPSIPQNVTTNTSIGGNKNLVSNESTQIPATALGPDTKVVSAIDGAGKAVVNGGITPSGSIVFVLSGSIAGVENGAAGINTFECSIDGLSFYTCTSPVQYSKLADGAHILQARSLDKSGNKDPSPASFTWNVDTVPPDTIINNTIDGNNRSLTDGSETESTSATLTFSGTDTSVEEGEDVGINHFECSIDGSAFSTCTTPVQYDNLANGSHMVEIITVDNSGNKDPTPSSFTWKVNTGQETGNIVNKITGVPSRATNLQDTVINSTTDGSNNVINNETSTASSTIRFDFSTINTKGVDHFECSMDSSEFVTCTSPFIFPNLSDGKHVFMVRFVDLNGNKDETPAAFVWEINR